MMKLTDITVVRTIPASAEKVFDLWMNPKSPGGPWYRSGACDRESGCGWSLLYRREA